MVISFFPLGLLAREVLSSKQPQKEFLKCCETLSLSTAGCTGCEFLTQGKLATFNLRTQCVCGQLLIVSTLCDPMNCNPPGSSVHGIFPARLLGAGCHFLLQGICLTQGLNPCFWHLLHWYVDSLPLSHLGSPMDNINFLGKLNWKGK